MYCLIFSDDEFEPINVRNGKEAVDGDENEATVNGVQPPLYLRDCMAGLKNNCSFRMPELSEIVFINQHLCYDTDP